MTLEAIEDLFIDTPNWHRHWRLTRVAATEAELGGFVIAPLVNAALPTFRPFGCTIEQDFPGGGYIHVVHKIRTAYPLPDTQHTALEAMLGPLADTNPWLSR